MQDTDALAPPELAAFKPVAYLHLKATVLLLFTLALTLGAALYLLYARGVFEPVQHLVLLANDSEGVSVGMDMTFSGIPIGRVQRIELAPDGNARILIDVPRKDAHWLRESSIFTLVRGLVGGTTIKAYSGILDDPPLFADGAGSVVERSVLRGDATAELPQVLAMAREILANVERLTAQDAPLSGALADLHALTQRMQGQDGVLSVLLGSAQQARQITSLLASAQTLLQRTEQLLARADRQVFDANGLLPQVQAALAQTTGEITTLLGQVRHSLTRMDAVLAEAQAVGANARGATQDLDVLRAEVESNLRHLEDMLGELQGKWPFARQPTLQLP